MGLDGFGKVNSLVIKQGVLIKAFNLEPFLSIPYGIYELSKECFYNQTVLEEVIMSPSVKKIEENAFEGCIKLRNIIFSKNIEYIGRNVFSDCMSLRIVTFPEELLELGFGAFNGCKNLAEVTLFNKVQKIDSAAFIHTRINTVNYRGSLLDWLNIDFANGLSNPLAYGAKLMINDETIRDLVIPNTIEVIKNNSFNGCKSIRSVNIKDGIVEIGNYAFSRCYNLKRVYIPKSVKKVGRGVFSGCSNLVVTLSEKLFESMRKRRCPVCGKQLPYFEYVCKYCNTEFKVYEHIEEENTEEKK